MKITSDQAAGGPRYGSRASVMTRVGLTICLVTPVLFLALNLLLWTQDEDSRMAALMLWLLGISVLLAIPLARVVWRPTAEWRHQQTAAEALARRLQDRLDWTPSTRD